MVLVVKVDVGVIIYVRNLSSPNRFRSYVCLYERLIGCG